VGETLVDLRHLLEDIRDAYTGSLEETIVTEIVANALDASASRVAMATDPGAATLTIVDDGVGMTRRELARYHDIATSAKRRGEGIGFAGVGIKLGLVAQVITETRRGSTHVATRWAMAPRHRAPWKWTPPPGMVPARGTAVQLTLENPLSPLLDAGFLDGVVRQHFEPLLDLRFRTVLGRRYADGVVFSIDGQALWPPTLADMDVAPVSFRLTRKRTPSAVGYLARAATPLPAERAGIAVSTLGKVILRGWDWLGLSPAEADRVTGLIEVPGLAECLTLNKSAFLRTGARGATYLPTARPSGGRPHQLGEWGETSRSHLPFHDRRSWGGTSNASSKTSRP
jgi:anti-sigma regulatory factor (Ser/Thr protein kinase)